LDWLEDAYEKMDHYSNGCLCISGACNSRSGFQLGENANGVPPKESVTALALKKSGM